LESGLVGPGPVDLAHMRWNLALDYGIQAAEDFLAIYRTLTTGHWSPQRSSGPMAPASRSLSSMTVAPVLTGRGAVGSQVALRSNSRKKS
jgi:hypothetical protein